MGTSSSRSSRHARVRPDPERAAADFRAWPFVVAVSAAAAIAGVVIAGLPSTAESFVLDTHTTTTALRTLAVADADADPDVEDALAVGDVGEGAAPTTSSTTSSTSTTSTTSSTTSTTAAPRLTPPDRLVVVVANGAGVSGLAGRTVAALVDVGYVQSRSTDARTAAERTSVVFAPGFADDAAALASALGLSDPVIRARTDEVLTTNGADADADLVLLLGDDAPRQP
ncbi:MAG: LytR C-terminal domain-containing protein [Acidimicrobiales bacterium]|nr:LytR C-terminal domain-containing protein [Acidimicrobiales bacterium]